VLLAIGAARPSTGILIAGWALAIGGWFGAWRSWRGPLPGETSDRRDFLRNARQKGLIADIGLTAAMVALQIDRIWGKHGAATVGIYVFGIVFFASGLGMITVHLLNRPRWSIPPDLRPRHHRRERP
jgi:hypothetical protein